MEFVCLDIETTGLNQEENEIIEVAAVKFTETEILESYQTFVNYQKPIPVIVEHLTGITVEMTKDAPTLESVKQSILDFCGNAPIVGHNINFDINFLKEKGVVLNNTLFDTLPLSHILINGISSHSLEILCRKFCKKYQPSHRAEDDCLANIELFYIFLDKIKNQNSSCNHYWKTILEKNNSDWGKILLQLVPQGQAGQLQKPEYLALNQIEANSPILNQSAENINQIAEKLSNKDLLVISQNQETKLEQEFTKIHDQNSEISVQKFEKYLLNQEFNYQETILLLKIAKGFADQSTVHKEDLNLFGEDYNYLNQMIETEFRIPVSDKPYLINHFTYFKLLDRNLLPEFQNIYFENLPFIEETFVRSQEKRIAIYDCSNSLEDDLKFSVLFRDLAKIANKIKATSENSEMGENVNVDIFTFTSDEFQQFLNNLHSETENKNIKELIENLKSNYQANFIWIHPTNDELASLHFIAKNVDQNFELNSILSKSPTQNIYVLNNQSNNQEIILNCTNKLPDPNAFGFNKAIKEFIFEEVKSVEGQALIIAPAKVQINDLHKNLARELDQLGITLLTQDISGSKGKILDNIENKEGPIVLLCTQYFYLRNYPKLTNLKKVFITKFPMSLPNHTYYEYKKGIVQNSFMELLVPNTANTIFQIIDQSIQDNPTSQIDYYLLDNRLTSKDWGISISNHLPNNIIVKDCQ
jgi:DNA polymerase III epsilon subunit family exonuclease